MSTNKIQIQDGGGNIYYPETLSEIVKYKNNTNVSDELDKISTSLTSNINNYNTHSADGIKHITSAERTKWNTVDNKIDKVSGMGLSSNNFTTEEKNKLAAISSNANNYSHPTYTSKANALYKITVDTTGHVSGTTAVSKADITALGIPGQDTTYPLATSIQNGLLSSTDKATIDSLDTKLATKLNLTGGILTGTLSWKSETSKDLLSVSGSTDSARLQWIVNSYDNTELRFQIRDDVSTKFTWHGNDTPMMTLQPTGTGTTVSGGTLNVAGAVYSNGKMLHATNSTTLSLSDKVALKGNDTWLRINEGNTFSDGVYFGTSTVRTDGALQVGATGSTLNVNGSTFTYKGNAIYHAGNPANKLANNMTVANGGGYSITQEEGTWWQKICVEDSSDKTIHRFNFKERQGEGSYVELFGVDGNGELYAKGRKVYHEGNKPTPAAIGAAASSHTHSYAGSSSVGGAATSALACTGNSATATKLATGRAINGVSFDGSKDITIYDSTKVSPTGTIVANRVPVFSDTTGKVIKDSGFTIATSVPSGAQFTDTNTWRGVQDNLTSTATDQSLSANQGKVLKTLIDGKAASMHTHDDRYFTEAEIGSLSWKVTPKKLAENTDLNTVYESGIYSSDSDGNSVTLKNRPTGTTGFILQVHTIYGSETVAGRQIQVAYMRGLNDIYIRDKSENASWSAWKRINENTWRGIQDNLTSSATDQSLSANQGKVLKSLVDGKANSSHTHDDRYYTETEMNSKLDAKLNLTGGTLSGKLFANGDIRIRSKVDIQYNSTTESLDFVFI